MVLLIHDTAPVLPASAQHPGGDRAPERLRSLLEHALIQTISSNRIEGVVVEQARIQQVVLGRLPLSDRDEQEVRGYREALSWIHENYQAIPVSLKTIRQLIS